jgi:AbrB family looped-hinge helix DNA binding protein
MKVSIDRAGRVVVPKSLRDQLGFLPGTPLEAEVVDGRLEIARPYEPARVIQGPNGPVVSQTGTPLTDEQVRRTLELVRAHR